MTLFPPEYETAPSWVPPIMVGALVTLLAQVAAQGLGADASCCCGLALPLGALASHLAYRRDPALTPGQGFTVAFIACGLGSAAMALIMIMEMGPEVRDQIAEDLRRRFEEFNQQAAADQKLSPEDLDKIVDLMQTALPYAPAVGAMVCTLLSAVSGLLAVLLLRGRRPRPQPPGDAV